MKVSFHGVGEQIVSFEAAADVQPGGTVKLSDNGKAAACGDGDVICGTAVTVRGGIAGVMINGYCRLAYSGTTAPAVGYQLLAADGKGGVKAVTTGGRQLLVVDVDAATKTAGIIL